jgi:flagellar protein FliJ
MSRTLEALIKVHQHQVDEQRRVVTQLEEARAFTQNQIDEQRIQMGIEREAARTDMDAARQLPEYLDMAIDREKNWTYHLQGLDGMIEAAREELQNRFADLKKFELANEAELEELRRTRLADENAQLDEIAGQRDQARRTD